MCRKGAAARLEGGTQASITTDCTTVLSAIASDADGVVAYIVYGHYNWCTNFRAKLLSSQSMVHGAELHAVSLLHVDAHMHAHLTAT